MQKSLTSTIFSFKGLYAAFFIAVVFYGQLRMMFGLTPRHIAIVVMLIACMKQDGVPFPMGRIMKTYMVFILTYLVSATITGYIGNVLITYYIASCVGFWATKILVEKHRDGNLLLNLFIVFGVLDAIVSIGQTFGLHFADQLVSFFNVTLPEKYLEKLDADGGEDRMFMLTRPGLFSDIVYNSYFLMTAGVTSLILLVHKFRFHRLIPWLVIMGGCICVQERGPIIILAVLSAIVFYKIFRIKKNRYALLVIVFAFATYYLTEFISSMSLEKQNDMAVRKTQVTYDDDDSDSEGVFTKYMKESRFADVGLDDSGRGDIYSQAVDYLMDHPFIGGLHRLRAMYGIYPHNLFINAFIYGGIVGGVAIMLILFWQIKPLWRVLSKKINTTDPVCFIAGLAYLAYTLNSLAHNRSIVTGDEVVWLLWGLFFFEYIKFYKQDMRL